MHRAERNSFPTGTQALIGKNLTPDRSLVLRSGVIPRESGLSLVNLVFLWIFSALPDFPAPFAALLSAAPDLSSNAFPAVIFIVNDDQHFRERRTGGTPFFNRLPRRFPRFLSVFWGDGSQYIGLTLSVSLI